MPIWGRPAGPAGRQTTRPGRREGRAESVQKQYLWNTPDGTNPDFSETYTHGDAILISWNALNNSIYDLWLTSWNLDPDPVTLCLARSINLANDGHLQLMTSDTPTAQLANETRYVLRFKPPTGQGEFIASDPDLASPGFLLLEPNGSNPNDHNALNSSGSPTTGSFPTTSRAASSPGIGTSTAEPGSDGHLPNISPGAAAGLTIGLIVIVALLVAMEVGYLMWRRKKRREQGQSDGSSTSSLRRSFGRRGRKVKWPGKGDKDRGLFVEVEKSEMVITESAWMSPELPGDTTWGQRLVHELQGSRLARGGGLGRTLTVNSLVVELEAGRDR